MPYVGLSSHIPETQGAQAISAHELLGTGNILQLDFPLQVFALIEEG